MTPEKKKELRDFVFTITIGIVAGSLMAFGPRLIATIVTFVFWACIMGLTHWNLRKNRKALRQIHKLLLEMEEAKQKRLWSQMPDNNVN